MPNLILVNSKWVTYIQLIPLSLLKLQLQKTKPHVDKNNFIIQNNLLKQLYITWYTYPYKQQVLQTHKQFN